MKRYLRLYLYFLQFSFSKAMEFRLDFAFRIFMDCLYYLIQFLFFEVIYLHTPVLAGWTIEELRLFVASYLFIDALYMTVFANNCWWLPQYINNGTLDYYLTKPVSSMFFMSLREFAANSFVNLLIACSLLIYFLYNYPHELGLLKIALFLFLLILGVILYYMINFIFLISTFWTGSPRGFGDLFFAVSHTMERPHRIFTGVLKTLFTFILPFSVIASMPVLFLIENDSFPIFFQCLITAIVFIILGRLLWIKGLRDYTSASS